MRWAVFLDRDGTVNEEVHYLHQAEQLRLLPGAAEAIRLLNESGIPVFLVTNQAGIGRGYYDEPAMRAVHSALEDELAAHGAHLDAIYHCPHHPDAGCACRKPNPGLLIQAAEEHDIDLEHSFVIGDKASDLEAGVRVGCLPVLVRTGYGATEEPESRDRGVRPQYVGHDLLDAARWVLGRSRVRP